MAAKRYAVLFLGLLASQPIMAKDVATEQYNVSAAREHYNEVRSEYEDLTQRVEAQAKRVAQEQARLDEMKRAARSRAERDFTVGAVVPEYLALYENVLGRSLPAGNLQAGVR